MNLLLQWPLSDQATLSVNASSATLATVTLCSDLTIIFKQGEQIIVVADHIQSSQLQELYALLNFLIEQKKDQVTFKKIMVIARKSADFSLTINALEFSFSCMIDLSTLVSWNRQLELLRIVMEENEQEQKQRTQGCC